ncbi:MAG: hypothetical protein INR65_16615 [Gluconacetobacter diazotrophicus]|nr:hypothetical protein [Gluconacetobacter diazotrophicus]
MRFRFTVPVVLCLAACGDLPQPFAEHPGAAALRLSVPPPARLDVPPPTAALLGDVQARDWSRSLAKALLAKEVPAVAEPVRRGDWHLDTTARVSGDSVVPTYAVLGPDNRVRARQDGDPVPAAVWSSAAPGVLGPQAAAAAERINAMLNDIQAKVAEADPQSLLNRPTRILFTGVAGAPGSGNSELAKQMTLALPDVHDTLVTDPKQADYTVSGQVHVSAPVPTDASGANSPGETAQAGLVQHVEIVWTVVSAKGHEAGRATQLHDVPAHTLDGYWGDVAMAASQEASAGVREVISNNEGRTGPNARDTSRPKGV